MAVTLNYIFPATGAVAPAATGVVQNLMVVDVTATADGDTTATIPHLMGVAPIDVTITPVLSQALAALSGWSLNAVPDATNVVCTKLATAGSGNAAAQLRVIIRRPHSIGR